MSDVEKRPLRQLMIDRDWPIDALDTVEDCVRARAVLTEAIVSIEYQLSEATEQARENGRFSDASWFRRTRAALRYKKLMLQTVQDLRARYAKEQRRDRGGAKRRSAFARLHQAAASRSNSRWRLMQVRAARTIRAAAEMRKRLDRQ